MTRALGIVTICLTIALDLSGAAAQSRITGTGVGPEACDNPRARCTTDREGRRWCQLPRQSRVLCGDPRFQLPQARTIRNILPEAIQRCVAAGVLRQGHFAGEESRAVLMAAIRAECKRGGYRPFLDPSYVPK
ncbi:MAG: hypothetical protein OXI22_04135 [Defluviicoccus sp.]|nr:hypothetical protein [Defluviicoccus sp.]MDE0383051.1 hypothetical protein [Defluviicoccus sp.]